MFNMVGNAWEWTRDQFKAPAGAPPSQEKQYVLRGGSYLDSVEGKMNHKLRVTTRFGRRDRKRKRKEKKKKRKKFKNCFEKK